MKKNKGFTLIELLTVIAILAVILLIAAPTILGVLDKAKRSTFKNQVLMYVEGLKNQVALNEIGQEQNIMWTGDIAYINFNDIDMDSANNYTGKIKVTRNNGKYTYVVIDAHGDGYKLDSQLKPEEMTSDNIVVDDGKEVEEYIITNIVKNGSFEQQNSNWVGLTQEFLNTNNKLTGNNSVYIKDSSSTIGYWYSQKFGKKIESGHILYYFMNDFVLNGVAYLYLTNSSSGYSSSLIKARTSETFKRNSNIFLSDGEVIAVQFGSSIEQSAFEGYVDDLLVVDLTETFGTGNEPSKEWCDKNIIYFEETIKIYK